MTQHPIVPATPVLNPELYQHRNGVTYLVNRVANGQVVFTPLNTIASQATQQIQPQPTQITPSLIPTPDPISPRHDPLAIVMVGLGAILLIAIGGYFLGFVAGKNGQSVVVVPRSPVCDTRRSSFLFWNTEQKECQ